MKPQSPVTKMHRLPWGRWFLRGQKQPAAGERPEVTFQEFAGAGEAKAACQELVDFLKDPQKYHRLGVHVPRKVLLAGPPGTGKRLFARAVAGEARVPFFAFNATELATTGESPLYGLLARGKTAGPAVLFFDRLDEFGRRRGVSLEPVNTGRAQALRSFMDQMERLEASPGWIAFAATRRLGDLDPALLEPGSFDLQLTLGLPDRRSREGILLIQTRPLRLARDVDLNLLARTTTGFSGADLANLCRFAALIAARQGHALLGMADFEEALDRILLRAPGKLLLSDEERRAAAYHEAGHALVGWLTPYALPILSVTILPQGRAPGINGLLSGNERCSYSRAVLLAHLVVMFGGRAAEELAIGDVTTGAEDDLLAATRLARRMVACWGMGSLGVLALDLAAGHRYSEATALKIDRDVQEILSERYLEARRLLTENRSRLDQLARILMDEETIGPADLARILGPRLPAGVRPGTPVKSDGSG